MIKRTKKSAVRAAAVSLAAILTAGSLASCGLPGKSYITRGGDNGGDSDGSYERYYAGSNSGSDSGQNSGSGAEVEFARLCDTVFKENATQSGLDLHYTLADPASRGITDFPLTLGQYSLEDTKSNIARSKEILKELKGISIQDLTDTGKSDYKVLRSALETDLDAEGLELYADPLASTIGIQAQLPVLLAEYPFYDREDVENYLALLSDIDRYYGQIMEFERQKSAAGLFMSDTAADHVLESCEGYLLPPDQSFLTETFQTRLDGLDGLTGEEKAGYMERNRKALEEHFIPAYKRLVDGITALMGTGTNENGLCFLPKGKEYFEYLVKANTGTSYSSVKALKKAIEDQMSADLSAISLIAKEHPEALDQLQDYHFSMTEPNDILKALQSMIGTDFPEPPANTCTVKYVPKALEGSLSPAFYLVPPLDRFEENVVYINNSSRFSGDDLFTTLAHEGYPGHLYQNVYFLSKNSSDLRRVLSFPSYSEGWASYVEYYAYTLDNGLDKNLGKILAHNSAATLGIYALLDIYINYEGWDREKTGQYLKEAFTIEDKEVIDSVFNALVENPTNYMQYYVGYMEISQMRKAAENVLGERFHLKDFHTFLLDFGPAPFSVIQPEFRLWLEGQRKSG